MLALIANPVAGMGGAVGLKGTDGKVEESVRLGAKPVVPGRVGLFLRGIEKKKQEIKLITCPAEMGEDYLKKYGFEYGIVSKDKFGHVEGSEVPATTSSHTKNYVREILKHKPSLIIFAGGDGTARDIYEVVGESVPILGIPCGVKVYSSAFAASPRDAAEITKKFLSGAITTKQCEVMDINEESFRNNILDTKLFGYASVPYEPALIPGSKAPTEVTDAEDQDGIAKRVAESMDGRYVLGPGTTVGAICKRLGAACTLLGVDVVEVKSGKATLLKADANESDLLGLVDGNTKIVISPIGHQGFIFGRGNQQISARVLEKVPIKNISIIATRAKLQGCNGLRIDVTPEINKKFGGHVTVLVGYYDSQILKLN